MKPFLSFVRTCLIIGIATLVTVQYVGHRSAQVAAHAKTNPTIQSDFNIDKPALDQAIENVLAENTDLDMSISMADLQTGTSYHWGDPSSFTAASINKLVTATAFLRMVEFGQASLDDRVGDSTARAQLTKMIIESDNTAWHNLNLVVTVPGLEAYARSIGMTSYQAGENLATSSDIALLLQQLAARKLLDNTNSDLLLSLMKQADMRNFLVAAVPSDATAYHKTGYLKDRLHDAAIIQKGERSFALVIFSKSAGTYDFSRGTTLFRSVTDAALSAFFVHK